MIPVIEPNILPKTFAEFEQWQPADGYKYEWNDGEVIIFEKMKKKHLHLIRILQQLFYKTTAFHDGGAFIMEQDVMLTGIQMRRPDLAFFSGKQIDDTQKSEDDEPIPEFVIEVISPSDDAEKVESKVIEYFKAGVQVVWNIFPEVKTVYVYTSRKTVKICTDNDICSAYPIIPDFEISVDNLFS
jgi:Uma2 family endonuclease